MTPSLSLNTRKSKKFKVEITCNETVLQYRIDAYNVSSIPTMVEHMIEKKSRLVSHEIDFLEFQLFDSYLTANVKPNKECVGVTNIIFNNTFQCLLDGFFSILYYTTALRTAMNVVLIPITNLINKYLRQNVFLDVLKLTIGGNK